MAPTTSFVFPSFCYHGESSQAQDLALWSFSCCDAKEVCFLASYRGKPFRKATAFVPVNFELKRLNDTLCKGGKRGICLYAQKPRIHLRGRDHNGHWLTRTAQPYPVRMCNAIAKDFYDARCARRASNFEKSLT